MIISCRFVPHDQWLVAHIDPSKSIYQIKHSLLARCITSLTSLQSAPYRPSSPLTFAPYPQKRPISPIRFAKPAELHRTRLLLASPSRSGSDTDQQQHHHPQDGHSAAVSDLDSPYNSDSHDTYPPIHHRVNPRSSPTLPPHVPVPDTPDYPPSPFQEISPEEAHILSQFSLIRFSTGQILEDDFQASWYSIRPHELLEIHHSGIILRLPRALASDYSLPYFEAQVRVLSFVGPSSGFVAEDDKRHTRSPPEDEKRSKLKDKDKAIDKDRHKKLKHKEPDAPAKLERARTKKYKLEWKDKWLVIRAGVINVCQDQHDANPHQYHLSCLTSLRGTEQLADANVVGPLPQRVICAEFRGRQDVPTTSHAKESSKGKDSEKKRLSSLVSVKVDPINATTSNADDVSGEAATSTHVSLKRSALRLSHSRSTDLAVTRSPDQPLTRTGHEPERGKSRGSKHPRALVSNATSNAISWSNTASPIEPSFVFPDNSASQSVSDSAGDTVTLADEDGGGGDGEDEEGEWIVLDLLGDDAYTSILRILHRHFPPPISSSFLPVTSQTPVTSHKLLPSPSVSLPSPHMDHIPVDANQYISRSSVAKSKWPSDAPGEIAAGPPKPPLYSYGTVPYPEWRISVVERAQRAGVGDISPSLSLLLWGKYDSLLPPHKKTFYAKPEHEAEYEGEGVGTSSGTTGPISSESDDGSHETVSGSRLHTGDTIAEADESRESDKNEDVDDTRSVLSNDSSEERSEAEWEGWIGDLGRQQERSITGIYGESSSFTSLERDVRMHEPFNVTQRLTQESRRALEPSAVVTRIPVLSTRPRGVVMMSAASTVSPLPISPLSSTVSVASTSSSSVEMLPGAMPFSSYAVTHGTEVYRAPLRTKMSIEEVLETANATGTSRSHQGYDTLTGQHHPDTDERRMMPSATRLPVSTTPVPASPIRKRPATSAESIFNNMDASADDPGACNSLSPTSRKGKGKERDDGNQLSSKRGDRDRRVASGSDREKAPPSNLFPPPGAASGAMASTTSFVSIPTAKGRISTSESGSIRSRSRTILRHVRSGSSLYDTVSTTSSGSTITVRKGVGFGLVRGVSARAGRLVKGLDAALDFVDAR